MLLVALMGALMGLLLPVTPAQAAGDDYKWRTDTTGARDDYGFTRRQCVSFAAWRLAQVGHTVHTSQGWGNANKWDDVARARGKVVNFTPKSRAIAHWEGSKTEATTKIYDPSGSGRVIGYMRADPTYGHVGSVLYVYGDGTALVEQYNLAQDPKTGRGLYSKMRVKAPRYIHI